MESFRILAEPAFRRHYSTDSLSHSHKPLTSRLASYRVGMCNQGHRALPCPHTSSNGNGCICFHTAWHTVLVFDHRGTLEKNDFKCNHMLTMSSKLLGILTCTSNISLSTVWSYWHKIKLILVFYLDM